MCVGLYTHYAHCDQAYYAVRLVELLRISGVAFDIYSDTNPGRLRLPYDRAVRFRPEVKFTDWAQKRKTIIWTHVPRIEQLNYCARLGIQTIVVPMWQDLQKPFRKALKRADAVVALGKEAQELYADVYKLSHSTYIPFDTGLPITRKDRAVSARQVNLFLPWFDRNARCSNQDFLGVLSYLLEHMPDAHLKVAVNSSRFGPSIAKFFTRLGGRTEGRVSLVRAVPYVKRAALFAEADLTLWPGECDNYGLWPLVSLSAGAPVLSFGLSPQTDFLHPDVNSVLVKTKTDYDENGVPRAMPDYLKYGAAMQELIAEPQYITSLQKKTTFNLPVRRSSFEGAWCKMLGLT